MRLGAARRWFPGFALLMVYSLNCRSENTSPQQQFSPHIDIPAASDSRELRGITLDDMVSLRELHTPRQSPDARQLAFVVKQGFRECDCYRWALYVVATKGSIPAVKLVESSYVSNIQWSPDSRYISYLSSEDGTVQLWRYDLRNHRFAEMFAHAANADASIGRATGQFNHEFAAGMIDYRFSPDGKRVAFSTELPVDPSVSAHAAKEGFRYDDATMSSWALAVGDWNPGNRPKQVWLYDLADKRERLVWTGRNGDWNSDVLNMLWSPSGKWLAFAYGGTQAGVGEGMVVVDAKTGATTELGAPGGSLSFSEGVAWSPDEGSIAYLASSPIEAYTLFTRNILDGKISRITESVHPTSNAWVAWEARRHRILFVSAGLGQDREQAGLYSVPEGGGEPRRLTSTLERVNECDAVVESKVACVLQSPTLSPRPALVSVVDGTIRRLANINPEFDSIELGPVTEMYWINEFGDPTNGFLVLPKHRVPGTRLPLVVVGYNFDGQFVTQANEALTTYPVQALARDGIAALLFNLPRYTEWDGPNFRRGSRALGYGPLSSIQAILHQLDSEGLIDTTRLGMMGHSLAGFWVQFAISHTDLFRAVEMHNGGTVSEPGTYWWPGRQQARDLQEYYMGGPPYGDTLKNYLQFSFTLNAAKIHAPVLMEYDALSASSAMEYYEAMRHYQVPVDFFVYPNDGHVTRRPEHRFMSLQRNLDWFDFWLLDKENDSASKGEQYTRWRAMREQLRIHAKTS